MKDTIIKETGNSRFLRSSVAEGITFAEFITLLRAGQLPIDLAGINEDGIDTLGMSLGKSTLLDDETETVIWGSPGDHKPTEALKTIFETLKTKVVTGTYTGDNSSTRIISLGFTPKAVLVLSYGTGLDRNNAKWGGLAIESNPAVDAEENSTTVVSITTNGFIVYRGSCFTNAGGCLYSYIAIA